MQHDTPNSVFWFFINLILLMIDALSFKCLLTKWPTLLLLSFLSIYLQFCYIFHIFYSSCEAESSFLLSIDVVNVCVGVSLKCQFIGLIQVSRFSKFFQNKKTWGTRVLRTGGNSTLKIKYWLYSCFYYNSKVILDNKGCVPLGDNHYCDWYVLYMFFNCLVK